MALALAGCASLGGAKPPAIYDISAPTDFAGLRTGTARQLLVPLPTAIDALGSARIVVREPVGKLSYYPGATWSDELPSLVQTKLVRAFENSGRAKVGRPGESLAIDYQVIVDIRAFELDVSQGRSAHVALGVKLLDDRTGKVKATKVFDAVVPAGSDAADAVVRALDAAADRALTDVVVWTAGLI
nr:ABC-type transport auxiliary lipoprotein family protein [Oharaeibacter diazotrophicus]